MSVFLGIDTSNYTTSTAIYDTDSQKIEQSKKLLPVKDGELGLRQADAVFAHVKQLGDVTERLFLSGGHMISAVGASFRPRDVDGSYMPCFMVGETAARVAAAAMGVPLYRFSHQAGHVAAALYSAGRLDLMDKRFIAFHLSGGTTEGLLVEPSDEYVLRCTKVAGSLDLKAGQAVDRVGALLGLAFPAGAELEKLAEKSEVRFKIKATMKGENCCLSGIENRCEDMLKNGASPCDVAKRCLCEIEAALVGMTRELLAAYGDLPLVYAGGVMSNAMIRGDIEREFGGLFAEPQFSSDNAAGIAVLAARRSAERGA